MPRQTRIQKGKRLGSMNSFLSPVDSSAPDASIARRRESPRACRDAVPDHRTSSPTTPRCQISIVAGTSPSDGSLREAFQAGPKISATWSGSWYEEEFSKPPCERIAKKYKLV